VRRTRGGGKIWSGTFAAFARRPDESGRGNFFADGLRTVAAGSSALRSQQRTVMCNGPVKRGNWRTRSRTAAGTGAEPRNPKRSGRQRSETRPAMAASGGLRTASRRQCRNRVVFRSRGAWASVDREPIGRPRGTAHAVQRENRKRQPPSLRDRPRPKVAAAPRGNDRRAAAPPVEARSQLMRCSPISAPDQAHLHNAALAVAEDRGYAAAGAPRRTLPISARGAAPLSNEAKLAHNCAPP
jgi:hypothetical protein